MQGKDGVVRGLSLLHKGHHIDRPLNLVCSLEIRQGVASDKGVPTAQSQPRLNEPESEDKQLNQPKRRFVKSLRMMQMLELCYLTGTRTVRKIELHSIFRGA